MVNITHGHKAHGINSSMRTRTPVSLSSMGHSNLANLLLLGHMLSARAKCMLIPAL